MQDFVNRYSLSKTLRFELRPVGETAEKIEDFKSESLKEIVRQDKKRAEDYKEIKKLIDDYHRYFISEVLSDKDILTEEELEGTFDKYTKAAALKNNSGASKTDKAVEEWKKEQIRLREKIGSLFKKKIEEYHLFDDNLVNDKTSGKNKTKPVLWQWIRKRLDRYEIDEQKFAEYEALISSFNKFSTYFVGFNQNRANIYSKEEQTTAIAYRVVNENMVKFFDNCIKFERIRQNHTALADVIGDYIKGINKSTDDFFRPQAFKNFLAQSDIDLYNAVAGGKSDEQKKERGVNQLINEYRQQNKVENRKLPMMEVLYKQILSDRQGGFAMVEAFENDTAALCAVKECYEAIMPETQQLKNCVISNICTGGNLEQIYIKADALTDISQKIWGEWGLIKRSLEAYSENQFRTRKDKESFLKKDAYSISEVQAAIDEYLTGFDDEDIKSRTKSLVEYFGAGCFDEKIKAITEYAAQAQRVFDEGQFAQKEENTEIVKNLLDAIMEITHFVRPLYLVKEFKPIDVPQKDEVFYAVFNPIYDKIAEVIPLYNKVRNYAAKKPYSTEKFKINFQSPTLLNGWDVTKETANNAVIFIKQGRYYLGVMNKNTNKLFDYVGAEDDSSRIKAQKNEVRQAAIAVVGENYYEKMIYKLLPDPSKMLPKVIFSTKWVDYYAPSKRILEIREKELHKKDAGDKEAMYEWIDFLKQSIAKHPEWNNYFKFSFTPTRSYEDSSQFYKEVAQQGFCISFDKIKADYINDKIESGELYLFEIYSKDFSQYSKGKPNLHTSYWKLIFSEENLRDTVIKLNGEAEIFFRPSSLEKKITHRANEPIRNRRDDTTSTFAYDVIKDRRFTRDKFFFHCPITLNFKAGSAGRFNDSVNQYLANNPAVNVIGIDRGERHLLYYTVVNSRGEIIEQKSFNQIINSYEKDGREIEVSTDYHSLLDEKEKRRDEARKSWKQIGNIKELKSGYLSHIVHQLATLMIKYNAMIVLEDLNFGFKRGRFKVEKQVYQKFEKALIDKLNYLVFKDTPQGCAGHYMKAYQLTAGFESFKKLGKQSGFLFYVASNYTSKIDPVTGFVDLLKPKYESVDKSLNFLSKFDRIGYNGTAGYFEFAFDYDKFNNKAEGRKKWAACTHGGQRYAFNPKTKQYECVDVTAELKRLFDDEGINYLSGGNLVEDITKPRSADFFRKLIRCLSLALQLRHTCGDEDFILSPVADRNGNFFDSRKAPKNLPQNADANGAYHIALKGLMTLTKQINKTGKPAGISNKDWFEYRQEG